MQTALRIDIAALLATEEKLVAQDRDFKLFGGETRDREDQTQTVAETLDARDPFNILGRAVGARCCSGQRIERALQPVYPGDERRPEAPCPHQAGPATGRAQCRGRRRCRSRRRVPQGGALWRSRMERNFIVEDPRTRK